MYSVDSAIIRFFNGEEDEAIRQLRSVVKDRDSRQVSPKALAKAIRFLDSISYSDGKAALFIDRGIDDYRQRMTADEFLEVFEED